MFDYSRMEGRFFEPDDKICLIFCNSRYDKLRKLPEFANKQYNDNELVYADLPRARKWADEFEKGI